MKPLRFIEGTPIPFASANVDTDQIIPSDFMKTVARDGLGAGAFAAIRAEAGNIFDDPRYAGATILLAGANFGCGSSREHAVWALQQFGFQAIIAPSFGEIFEGNALRNGLIAIRLKPEEVEALLEQAESGPIGIDIAEERVIAPNGRAFRFQLDPFRKHCLMNGLDDISLTLECEDRISEFERRRERARPWEGLIRP